MKLPTLLRRSLTTRVTLFTLAILVLGVATVTLWTGHLLRHDIQALLEQQQFSTATILAAEINHELADRKRAVERVAAGVSPVLLADAPALQQHLQKQRELQAMFNAGTFVTSSEGTAVVSLPSASPRVGVNYMALDFVTAALINDKATIGKPVFGQPHKPPWVSMAAPIHNPSGQVIGALVGVINLGETNFLHNIIGKPYGTSGGFMLVDQANRLIVTHTDPQRALQTLPDLGVDALTDKFVAGFEGSGVATNLQGQQVLVAAKNIPVANWYLAVDLPTLEAFSPMNALQQRLWGAIALLTLLTASLTWWMLRRQLLPMVRTAAALAAWPSNSPFPAQLPVAVDDEIGQLIAGFNQLLNTLQQREQTLKESEENFRSLTQWTHEALLVHCCDIVLYANPAAVRLLGASSAEELLGQSMLRLVHPEECQTTLEGYQRCAEQGVQPIHEQRWFRLDGSVCDVEVSAIAIQFDVHPALLTAARDITERKRADTALRNSLRDKDALLNEVHHRVKNNLQVISSLLRLETGRSKQPETSCVLQEMQGRIRTMALLYETLYRTDTFASVNLADYLKQIATQALRAQSHGVVQLQLALNAVQVSMDRATPCGLLVNELISNALKHAFPDERPGELSVSLQPVDQLQEPDQLWCLRVSDNGVGLPTDFEQRRGQSLGLQLVGDLVRQLGSVLDIQAGQANVSGASFSVFFTPNSSDTGRVHLPVSS
jgi:PAS domain S-box-containing protein